MSNPSAIQYSKILLELLFNEDLVWYFSNVRGWCTWLSFAIAIAATIVTTTGPIVVGAVFTCTPIVNEQWDKYIQGIVAIYGAVATTMFKKFTESLKTCYVDTRFAKLETMLTEAHNEREVFRTRLEETTVELGKACADLDRARAERDCIRHDLNKACNERDCIRADLNKACDERDCIRADLKETIDDLEQERIDRKLETDNMNAIFDMKFEIQKGVNIDLEFQNNDLRYKLGNNEHEMFNLKLTYADQRIEIAYLKVELSEHKNKISDLKTKLCNVRYDVDANSSNIEWNNPRPYDDRERLALDKLQDERDDTLWMV